MNQVSIAVIKEDNGVPKLVKSPSKIAKFEIVSFDQFKNDLLKTMPGIFDGKDDIIESIYKEIKLPERATADSAGYDFYTPFSFIPKSGSGIVIPTGIRCKMDTGWVLQLYPRSGQGFKYGIHLYNTVGIIDGDYYYADNEGHIMVKVSAKEQCDTIKKGIAFCQGIFLPYGITVDDNATGVRTGGFGSTSKE